MTAEILSGAILVDYVLIIEKCAWIEWCPLPWKRALDSFLQAHINVTVPLRLLAETLPVIPTSATGSVAAA
jgi:hypothetical protein